MANLRQDHMLYSAHRCKCGWEGNDAITHIIDSLGLRAVEVDNDGIVTDAQTGNSYDQNNLIVVTTEGWR